MSGKLGITDGVVEEELEDLVVEEPAFLPRVGHVGGGTLSGAVDARRAVWSRTVVLRGSRTPSRSASRRRDELRQGCKRCWPLKDLRQQRR